MKKFRKGCLISVSIIAVLIIVSAFAIKHFKPSANFDWWWNELNIDTDNEYIYPIEYEENSDVERMAVVINGKRFLDDATYSEKHKFYSWTMKTEYKNQNVNNYYIEDLYRGCRGEKTSGFAAFGTSAENISFVLRFGIGWSPYAAWFVAEDYVFPDITKDVVSSVIILKCDEIVEVYEAPSFLHRVKQENATATITDKTVIDDIIKNKNYDLLNEYIEDDEQYVVLAQFDGHIIYETITVMNDANL